MRQGGSQEGEGGRAPRGPLSRFRQCLFIRNPAGLLCVCAHTHAAGSSRGYCQNETRPPSVGNGDPPIKADNVRTRRMFPVTVGRLPRATLFAGRKKLTRARNIFRFRMYAHLASSDATLTARNDVAEVTDVLGSRLVLAASFRADVFRTRGGEIPKYVLVITGGDSPFSK